MPSLENMCSPQAEFRVYSLSALSDKFYFYFQIFGDSDEEEAGESQGSGTKKPSYLDEMGMNGVCFSVSLSFSSWGGGMAREEQISTTCQLN